MELYLISFSEYYKFLCSKVLIPFRRHGIGNTLEEVGFTTNSTEINCCNRRISRNKCARIRHVVKKSPLCRSSYMDKKYCSIHNLPHFRFLFFRGGGEGGEGGGQYEAFIALQTTHPGRSVRQFSGLVERVRADVTTLPMKVVHS